MEQAIEFKDAGFIVLPSLIIYHKDTDDSICYSVLEPNLGKYTLSKLSHKINDCPMEEVRNAFYLDDILYLDTLFTFHSVCIRKIYNNKSDEIITYPASFQYSDSIISWPWYINGQKTYVMQKNLQFSDYNTKISFIPKIIYPDKIRDCIFPSLIEIDETSYLNQTFEKQLFLKSNSIGWTSANSSYSFGIPGKYVYYIDLWQKDNPWKVYNLSTKLHFDCNFTSNYFIEMCRGLVYMSDNKDIYGVYLLNEDLNINSNIDIGNVGPQLIKMRPKNNYNFVRRIIENPFKTAERDRFAN